MVTELVDFLNNLEKNIVEKFTKKICPHMNHTWVLNRLLSENIYDITEYVISTSTFNS